MAGEENDSLNMPRIQSEIQSLRESLDEYRGIVEKLVTNAELLELSQRALRETEFPSDA